MQTTLTGKDGILLSFRQLLTINTYSELCYIGWPGSVHDTRVFANSSLFKKAENVLILKGQSMAFGRCNVPVFVIGDPAYPLMSWLMKPFPDNDRMTDEQNVFNYRLSRARIVVNAFGRLKARLRRLLKKINMHIDNVLNVVAAFCVLHNICEIHGETFDDT